RPRRCPPASPPNRRRSAAHRNRRRPRPRHLAVRQDLLDTGHHAPPPRGLNARPKNRVVLFYLSRIPRFSLTFRAARVICPPFARLVLGRAAHFRRGL